MGCDIHLAVEFFDITTGRWVNTPRPIPVHRYRDFAKPDDMAPGGQYDPATDPDQYLTRDWYNSRDYGVFSVLANVRNDTPGTRGYVPPIAQPRGLPANADVRTIAWTYDHHFPSDITDAAPTEVRARLAWLCNAVERSSKVYETEYQRPEFDDAAWRENNNVLTTQVREVLDQWPALANLKLPGNDNAPRYYVDRHPDNVADGEHSESWLLLSEVLAYAWDAELIEEGVVGPRAFLCLDAGQEPDSWCRSYGKIGTHESLRDHITYMNRAKHGDPIAAFITSSGNYHTVVTFPFTNSTNLTEDEDERLSLCLSEDGETVETIVDVAGFAEYLATGHVSINALQYRADINGLQLFTPNALRQYLRDNPPEDSTADRFFDSGPQTVATWKYTLRSRCRHFIQCMKEIRAHAEEQGLTPEQVRLVFNFDS